MAFVRTLTTDTGTVRNPTWVDVEAAIRQLDAKIHTLVVLAPQLPNETTESHMAIGGGGGDLCIVYVTEDNLSFWNLEDPQRFDGSVRMMIGGQEGEYRPAQCVPRTWALKAAHSYFDNGTRSDDLHWVAS
jgi:hypothetical protein